MKRIADGFLIVVEGIDGSGKSTLTQRLVEALSASHAVVQTREPGGTEFGKQLRQFLHYSEVRPTAEAEFLLFAADRMYHMQTVVKPALQEGKIVISDRLADSSMAYQGYGRGIDKQMITTINQWALQGVEPDLIIYVDLDWQIALERIQKSRAQLTAFEQEDRAFFERVAQGFRTIMQGRANAHMIDGRQSADAVFEQALDAVLKKLSGRS